MLQGFFRRSLLRQTPYKCFGAGKCNIRAGKRKICPKCRHTKCLAVGMSKEGENSEKQCLVILRNFSFGLSSRWHHSARKGPYTLHPISQQSPQGCPQNSANVCLVEYRLFPTSEGSHCLKLGATELASMLCKQSKLLGIYHSTVIFQPRLESLW